MEERRKDSKFVEAHPLNNNSRVYQSGHRSILIEPYRAFGHPEYWHGIWNVPGFRLSKEAGLKVALFFFFYSERFL